MSLGDRSLVPRDRNRAAKVAVAIAAGAAAYLTAGVLLLLSSSGYPAARLVFMALVVAISWAGVAGAAFDRPPAVIVAAVALLLLGFWQAVLWVFMLPASLGLVVAGVILAHTS